MVLWRCYDLAPTWMLRFSNSIMLLCRLIRLLLPDIVPFLTNSSTAIGRFCRPPVPMPTFEVSDLESLTRKYDTVVCLDVMIHYPQNKADAMIAHLASIAEIRLIINFAPKTLYYDLLKRIGELFLGPSKATRAYLHAEADIECPLQKGGWKIRKRGLTTTQFYFSRIVEAVHAYCEKR